MGRITRHLALATVCLAVWTFAWADAVPVRILIGTSEAPLSPAPVHDGAGVLAPLAILPLLGASSIDSSSGSLIITAAGGQSGTINTYTVNGSRMIPMDKLIALVGGEQRYDAAKRTLTLIAHLDTVEFDNDTLTVNCSLPVRATAKMWSGRIIVDVPNAKLASEAKEVYIGTRTVAKARLGQLNETTARVVLDLNKPTGYRLETTGAAPRIVLKLGDNLTPAPAPSAPSARITPAGQEFTVEGVSIQTVDEGSFNVIISTSARGNTISALRVSPPEIQIDLPKSRMGEACAVTGAHTAVKPELANTASGVRLTLRLARPLVYAIEIRDTQIMVYLHPPDKSGGKLAGKLIVIDPGHGGKENGARAGGCSEKNLNMQIAKDLASALAEQGAKVMLTRDSDKLMSLAARAEATIDAEADFLISVHCNSNLVPDSATGIETYYHMEEPSPKLLAYAVHDGVCKFTGMRDRRPRSDRSLYEGGLAVLRRLSDTGIPGVLLECGYVNNSSDRAKLLDAGYRAKLVAGIIAGFKAYVEGAPIE